MYSTAKSIGRLVLPSLTVPVPVRRRFSQKVSNSHYCMNLVEKSDYERYLSLLLLPSAATKTSAFAVAALNVQVARIFDATDDPNICAMRLQFWLETIDRVYESRPPEQPVALELLRAVERHKLSKHWLKRLVECRSTYRDNRPFNTLEDVELYAENSVSSFYYTLLEIVGVKDLVADHAASHLGKAHGLVTLLRAVAYDGSRGRVRLPVNVLLEHGVSEEEVIRGSRQKGVRDVFYDLASRANSHLQKAKSLEQQVVREAHCVFLMTVSLERYLATLQKANFDAFDPKLRRRNHLLPVHLLVRKLKGGF